MCSVLYGTGKSKRSITLARVHGWPFFFASSWKSLIRSDNFILYLLLNCYICCWACPRTLQSCPKPSNSPPHSPSPRFQPPSSPVCPPQLQALFHGEDRYTCTTIEFLRTPIREGPWGDADGLSSCDVSRGRLHEEERLSRHLQHNHDDRGDKGCWERDPPHSQAL